MFEHVQDTVSLERTIERTIVNDTVKITVQVQATVELGTSDDDLRSGIRGMLNKFIDTDKWVIANVRRTKDMKRERVSLTATARVPEGENKNLHNRAGEAGDSSMEISQDSISVDNSIPRRLIDEEALKMKQELAKLAHQDALEYNDLIPTQDGYRYRVATIMFGNPNAGVANNYNTASTRTRTLSASAEPPSVGSGPSPLGNSQKFSMTASYTLARLVVAIARTQELSQMPPPPQPDFKLNQF